MFGFVFFGEAPPCTKGTAKAGRAPRCQCHQPWAGHLCVAADFLGHQPLSWLREHPRALQHHQGLSCARGFPRTALTCHQCCFNTDRGTWGCSWAGHVPQSWTLPCVGWGALGVLQNTAELLLHLLALRTGHPQKSLKPDKGDSSPQRELERTILKLVTD